MQTIFRSRRALLLTAVAVLILLMIWSRLTPRPASLGVSNGRLASCPPRPNCVCTQDQDREHSIEPLPLAGSVTESLAVIRSILESTPRVTIVTSTADYIHAEFRSRLMGFIDDVEFLADPAANVIHFRSASRLGYSDFGVNRERMEQFRRDYETRIGRPSPESS